MVEGDIGKLEEYFKNFGFLDVKVSCERQWAPRGNEVNLIFHVVEGKRYQIQDTPHVIGIGNHSVPTEQVDQLLKVKAHDYYDQNKINLDKRNVTDYIEYTGRKVRLEPDLVYSQDAPGLVRVNYQVEEQTVAYVGQVFIVGNERTRQNVILRQLGLYPGQVLTYPDLRLAERNLARLGIFQISPDGSSKPTVTVLENPNDPNNQYEDILVSVTEDNTGSLMFGVGVNSDAGLTGSIVLNERNFDITKPPTSIDDLLSGNAWRGAGQEFRIEAVPGTQLQRYSTSWREPFLFDSLFSLTVGGYFYERAYNEDTEERVGGRITVGRKLNDAWTVNVGVRVENVNISNVPVGVGAPPDYTSVQGNNFQYGPSIGLTRDTRDSVMRATEGSLIEARYEQMFGEFTFPLLNLSASKFFTTYQRADGSGRHVLVLHSQVSYAGPDTPVYERYYGGGFQSIRGFAFRGVGPEVNGFKTGGDFQFLNSAEYQIPILANDKFYAVAFLDSGTVEATPSLRDYRVSAGFGFRFQIPMLGQVPIALDFGFPILKAATDNSQVFSFWLGFSR
jgi:outer membrane protein assembly complex protein YaeT